MAGRNELPFWIARDWPTDGRGKGRGAVLALRMLRSIVRIDLNDLAIVHIRAERLLYRFHVGAQGIGGNLYPISHPAGNVLNESISGNVIPLPAQERRYQFRLRINRAEGPDVAHLRVVVYSDVA